MRYYVRANTSLGVWDFTADNVSDVQTVVSLRSGNKNLSDAIISEFCRGITDDYDEILAPGSKVLKSGIVLKNKSLALVTNYNGASKSISADRHFGLWRPTMDTMPVQMEIAYKKAKKIHDDWEKIYISNMDFARLDSFCKNIISVLTKTDSCKGNGVVYKRFFGTTTVNGVANTIDNITGDLPRRYFIKGRPGTGKSTFLKKLSLALTEKSFDIEQYYCSFDPHSLDMVVSRELGFCVFDSTSPHEKFPEREGDVILDFYTESGLGGVDEKYSSELLKVKSEYNIKIKEGNEALREALALEVEENIKELAQIPRSGIVSLASSIKQYIEE